jgi:leader peptidase (prepilin peptidase)/N-methyltransferase
MMWGLESRDRGAALALGLAAVAVGALLGLSPPLIAATALLALPLAIVTFTDLRFQRIPDPLSLPLIPAGLLVTLLLWPDDILDRLLAAMAGAAALLAVRWAYRRWRGIEGLGLGDVKLLALAGAWTGLERLAPIVLIACLAALVVLLFNGRGGQLQRHTRVPLGAFLAPATLVAWLHLAAAH